MTTYFQICPHCKGEAFKYRRKPIKDEYMTAELVDHKRNPVSGDVIACQECDKAIGTNYFTPAYLGVIEEKKACVRDAEYDEACGGCWAYNDEKEKKCVCTDLHEIPHKHSDGRIVVPFISAPQEEI